MAPPSLGICWLVYVYVILNTLSDTAAFGILSRSRAPNPESINTSDLQALLRPDSIDSNEVYKEAIHVLASMQSSPTCIRYATSTLLYSCQAIEASNQDAENDLEDLKSVYATQLAICELSDAGSSVPQSCKGLAVTPGMKSTEHLKWIRKSKISECLKALESRPQSWTSYSNSKQNAVTLCRATRIDIEKDDTIKLHQEMVKTQSNANQALQEAAQVVQQGLQKLQSDFDSAREAFNNQLLREIKESTAQTQTLIATMTTSFSSALDSSLRKVRSYSGTLESHLAALTKNIKSASSSTTNLEHNVGKVFQKVVEGSSELAHVQTKQWETSRRVATELQASLKGMQQGDLASLIRSLNDMGVRLDASNELISRIYERQNNFEQRMDNLGHSFSRLESKAEAIGVAQQRQGETQEKLSQQMEVDMQVAQGFLTDVASSAMHLQATVSETSSKIQSMAAFAKVFSTILNWTYFFGCVVLLSIIVTAVAIGWQYNSRLTFYLLILLGVALLTTYLAIMISSGDHRLQAMSKLADFDDVFAKVTFAFGLLLGACVAGYYIYVRRRSSEVFFDSRYVGARSRFGFK